MTEEDEVLLLKQNILKVLTETKEDILKQFDELDFNPMCFDAKIDLKVTIDDSTIGVKEGWKKEMPPL